MTSYPDHPQNDPTSPEEPRDRSGRRDQDEQYAGGPTPYEAGQAQYPWQAQYPGQSQYPEQGQYPGQSQYPTGQAQYPGQAQYQGGQWQYPAAQGYYGGQASYGAGYYGGQGNPGYQHIAGHPTYPSYQNHPGYYGGGRPPYGAPPQAPGADGPRKRRRNVALGIGAGAMAAALVVGGVVIAQSDSTSTVQGSGTAMQRPNSLPSLPSGGTPGLGTPGSGRSGGTTRTTSTTATAKQQIGIVTIVSVLRYQNAESAGTGMVLTSDGEILTNNHVINGATKIVVTVESTGKSYRASVVGTAPTKDVALLQLKNASGLQTADLASSSNDVQVGDTVTGVGNAGGTGTLTRASGKITALEQSITASDETGSDKEKLKGLLETNAGIISGDSGGPLYDSAGEVVGMDTAASSSGTRSTAYAIPIEDALTVASQIRSGVETTTIHIGLPGFLGVAPKRVAGGVEVERASRNKPAYKAGIRGGSVITSIDGTAIKNVTQLHNVLSASGPGATVSIEWTTANGRHRSGQAVLATGPAD